MIKVAILGYGTVGSGVFQIIKENKELITNKAGQEIDIKYVLDLREFPGDPCENVLVHDYNIILNDPEVEVIIEVMGGLKPSYDFVKSALEAGKSVCTSNKELVAKYGAELIKIAQQHNRNFLFEAAVGGGIPVSYTHLVAIYIGGGQIIHASTEETGIIISGMGSPCAARRIIG